MASPGAKRQRSTSMQASVPSIPVLSGAFIQYSFATGLGHLLAGLSTAADESGGDCAWALPEVAGAVISGLKPDIIVTGSWIAKISYHSSISSIMLRAFTDLLRVGSGCK